LETEAVGQRPGLGLESSPYVAVFDADFVPAPDFLRRMLPHLADPRVGLVQARWGHLDRDAGWLARATAAAPIPAASSPESSSSCTWRRSRGQSSAATASTRRPTTADSSRTGNCTSTAGSSPGAHHGCGAVGEVAGAVTSAQRCEA
ncbi:MAG: group 2 glycosyl transferase, partial [Candidatus Eisenbacteria bacterium]